MSLKTTSQLSKVVRLVLFGLAVVQTTFVSEMDFALARRGLKDFFLAVGLGF